MIDVSTLIGVGESRRSASLRYGVGGNGPEYATAAERPPVVVWNVTRACNLACLHCYASARSSAAPGELTTEEALALVRSLENMRCPALLLSGGEPLVRPDCFRLVEEARSRGISVTLSTNGTLIDARTARRLASLGVSYVGISIDGDPDTHDRLRARRGAWQLSVSALEVLADAGVKRGIRFTLTPATAEALEDVLALVDDKGVERFCMYHLVPSGRGRRIDDVTPQQRLQALLTVFEFAASRPRTEVLTVANPSDSAVLYEWLLRRDARAARKAWNLMSWNGGARWSSGNALLCVDERGTVYPDQFSRHRPLGSLRRSPLERIWARRPEPPAPPRECLACRYFPICGGGLRVRAEVATGEPSGMDPSCMRALATEGVE